MNYGAAGLAAGLAASAGLAAIAALPASAGAAAEAAASGAGAVSSDLLQAVTKNIETSARSRTLRVAFSLGARCSVERAKLQTGQEYDRCEVTSSAYFACHSTVRRHESAKHPQEIWRSTCKKFFDYFVGICMILALFRRLLWRMR